MLREEGRALTVALGLLTRIPMPYIGEASQQTLGRSLHWYPAAGLVIGLALALFTALLPGPTLPSQALLGATLA
ncbi:MAG: adenosylcobinamide-GDP ribazoletransferase, partial [Porticoccaceae bacterium]|nr:adenosylcobinamide-GDP ribazoletransferase [Porticoccaceae bacterium]